MCILTVGVVFCFDLLVLEAQRVAVEAQRGVVGDADVEGDVLGAEGLDHGALWRLGLVSMYPLTRGLLFRFLCGNTPYVAIWLIYKEGEHTRLPHQLLRNTQPAMRPHNTQTCNMTMLDSIGRILLHLCEHIAYDSGIIIWGFLRA